MATIRAKLTIAYTGALLGSVAVFSVALYAARRSSVRRDVQREVAVEADGALRVLRYAATANEPVTVASPLPLVGTQTQITPRIAAILDGLPDYVMLMDTSGKALYLSPSVRLLQLQNRDGDYDRLMQQAVAAFSEAFGRIAKNVIAWTVQAH